MQIKKVLCGAVAALVAVSAVSCTQATDTKAQPGATTQAAYQKPVAEKDAAIKFTYWTGSTAEESAWKIVLDGFKKDHPEIKLDAQTYPSTTYVAQLDTMAAGNAWPDVMRYTYQRLGKFKEAGVMLDLTGKISKESTDDLVPAYRDALTYNGKLVGVPHHTDTIAIFYNKDMFAKSGIRIPTSTKDGWTWDEMTQIAKKLKADNALEYSFAGIWENKSAYRYLPFAYMNGASLISADGKKITTTTPEFKAAIKLYDDWRKAGLVVGTGFTQPPQANAMFVAKKLGFVFAGSWQCSYMQDNMPGNWGMTYMPQVNGKTGSDLGGNGLFAYKGTKYPNASAIFLDYISSKDVMKQFCEAGNFIPVRQSLIKEGLTFKNFQAEMNTFLNIATTIDPKMAQDETSSRFQQLNLIFAEEMDPLVVNGSATVDQVADNLQKKMQTALDDK